jgi:type IX secretion system substrate protein
MIQPLRFFIFLFFFTMLFEKLSAQLAFQKIYSDTTLLNLESMDLTNDGGFIMTGYSYFFPPNNNMDMYLLKTDAAGNTSWFKRIGTPVRDWPRRVRQTSDNGYIITGQIYDIADPDDFFLTKTDSAGTVLWSKRFTEAYGTYSNNVIQTNDGGYIISAGFTDALIDDYGYLLKTDSSGNVIWTKVLTDVNNSLTAARALQPTSDGGCIIAGSTDKTNSGGTIDIFVAKIDSSGNFTWSKSYDASEQESAIGISQTNDGGFIIIGGKSPNLVTNPNLLLLKTDLAGTVQWIKLSGNSAPEFGLDVFQDNDGGFSIIGVYNDKGLLIKTDSVGNALWSKGYGSGSYGGFKSNKHTNDGGYILAGHTNSFGVVQNSIYLVKTDANGNSGCNDSSININLISSTIQTAAMNLVISSGYQSAPAPVYNTVNTGAVTTLCFSTGTDEFYSGNNTFSVHPNPSSGDFIFEIPNPGAENISMRIFDLIGNLVLSETAINSQFILSHSNLNTGIYLVEIICGENKKVLKIVKTN